VLTTYARVKFNQAGTKTQERWIAHLDEVRDALAEAISGLHTHNAREVRAQRQRIARIKERQARLLGVRS